ncbi:T9SS type A sorting domain-containing protein [Chryseobacterium indologenes]|uniref:T9SS type A sorting domain-containing protein n=1 Tax=Chryseobacterium indologenes TaxID=253 RepID=UPI0007899F67|nr:T9SS type A sorting domain-containing protein [Chryseobacterium indologenes]
MKKIFTILGLASAIGFINAQTTVLTENFGYTGALNANGWITHSGTAGQLTANGSSVTLVAGNSEDVNKAFSSVYNVSATGVSKVDYSATINVASQTGLSTGGDYFLMLTTTAGANPGTIFNGRVYAKGSTTGYTLGVLNNAAGSPTVSYGTEIPYGTPANITLTYTINNSVSPATNIATLQINSQPLITSSAGTGTAPSTIAGIAIRQAGNASSGTGAVSISNLSARVYSTSSLAVSDVKNVKAGNFVKNTFVKSDEITFGADVKDVKVYNMFGQVVKTASVKNNEVLNVAELAKGNYIVTGTVNNEPVSQKILKD